MIAVIIILICALQSESIHSEAKTFVVTGLSFCQLFILMIASKAYRLFYTTCTFPYFLTVYIRHVEVFTPQFLLCQDFPLNFKILQGVVWNWALERTLFHEYPRLLNGCVFVTRISHPRNTCEAEVFFGREAPFKARELRQRLIHLFLRRPADSVGLCLQRPSLMCGVISVMSIRRYISQTMWFCFY